jgi:hypothetical protein
MSKKFFILVIGGFAVVFIVVLASIGGFAFFRSGTPSPASEIKNQASGPPGPPPTPQISLTIRKLKTGNSLIVEWTNLPETTAALDLFCSALMKPTASSSWTLWKEILLSSGELAAGNREVQLGIWYKRCSFYVVQAITAHGVGSLKIGATTTLDFTNGVTGSGNEAVLWTSGATTPAVTISTVGLPPMPKEGTSSEPSGGKQETNNNPSSTNNPSSAIPNPLQAQPTSSLNPGQSSSSLAASSSLPAPSASGTPYYNPQVQIYAYAASGSPIFWVQHAGQGIEIGWQNIPPLTDTIVILRSENQNGPWNAFMTQKKLPTNSYSLQVIDSSLNAPYYYEMQAISGSNTVATYGPDYLAPMQ